MNLEGILPSEVHRRMRKAYGDNCSSYSTVRHGPHFSSLTETNLDDDHRYLRASTAIKEDSVKAVKNCLLADIRVNIAEVERV